MVKTKFFKGILILFIAFFLLIYFAQEISAQGENYCLNGTPSFTYSAWSPLAVAESNALYMNDNNADTRVGLNAPGGGLYGGGGGWYKAEVGFDTVKPRIDRVEHLFSATITGTGGGAGGVIISLYYGGQWNQIDTLVFVLGGELFPKQTRVITTGGPWYNVGGVKVEASGGGSYCTIYMYTYEIRAFGQSYIDIGLRVFNGSQTVIIACEPDDNVTSPLRIAKDSKTYGVALVEPGDASDSGIRINTSSGIKALRKYP